jgi:chitinase
MAEKNWRSLIFNFMKNLLAIILVFAFFGLAGQPPFKVVAYYTGNSETIKKYPVDKLTHLIYSFLKLSDDHLVFRDDDQRKTVEKLVALKKQYPHLKIMVSIGGWGGCAPCSNLFASPEHRNNFARSVVALFQRYHIDGLDLDWEYPAIEGYPGHAWDKADRNNFTELVKALRKEMGSRFLLSFAAGGFVKYLEESIDWQQVVPAVDFVNLMTYDLVNGYSQVTGHHTLLYDYRPQQESTRKCVDWLLDKNVDSHKLIVGAAFYARVWENVDSTDHGLYQSGNFFKGISYRDFANYFNDSSGYKYFWDDKGSAPFQYNARKKLFATFDDKHSIRAKAEFVRTKNLGGIMFWELSQDLPRDGLLEEISKALH